MTSEAGHRPAVTGSAGHGHAHGPGPGSDRRYLLAALALLAAFMIAEVVTAVLSGSLALLSDAGHMLSDVGAIGGALWAIRLAARPPAGKWTFGWQRAEILSAAANGITLLVVAGVVTAEAITRLIRPPAVDGGPVIAVAVAGVAVNVAASWVLARADRSSLNVEGAFRHVLTDLYGFIGTVIAGIVIVTTGFTRADAIASLVVAALMLKAGLSLVRESWKIFLEAAPEGVDPAAVRTSLLADSEVASVHDLHIWTITSGFPALSAHVLVESGGDCHQVRSRLEEVLHGLYGINHTTLQVDHAAESLLAIGPVGSAGMFPPGEHRGHEHDAAGGDCHGAR